VPRKGTADHQLCTTKEVSHLKDLRPYHCWLPSMLKQALLPFSLLTTNSLLSSLKSHRGVDPTIPTIVPHVRSRLEPFM